MLKHTPDTGWPEDDHDWLKHVALICLIDVNINKFVLTFNTRGADKSLARPGRKQPTATKLAIYSTYSP